jgi:hypothetical protein
LHGQQQAALAGIDDVGDGVRVVARRLERRAREDGHRDGAGEDCSEEREHELVALGDDERQPLSAGDAQLLQQGRAPRRFELERFVGVVALRTVRAEEAEAAGVAPRQSRERLDECAR